MRDFQESGHPKVGGVSIICNECIDAIMLPFHLVPSYVFFGGRGNDHNVIK